MTLPASGNTISLSQVNTELGRGATATIDMNDSAVRALFQKTGSGTTISMSDGWGKSNVTISLATLTSVYGEANNTTATAGLDFNSNGYMSRSSSGYGTVSMGQWATSSSVGSNYWIRLTQTSQLGITTVTGAARGVWHQLSTTRTFGVSTSALGYGSKTYTVEIASDSGGSNIVASRTGIEIAAENVDQNA